MTGNIDFGCLVHGKCSWWCYLRAGWLNLPIPSTGKTREARTSTRHTSECLLNGIAKSFGKSFPVAQSRIAYLLSKCQPIARQALRVLGQCDSLGNVGLRVIGNQFIGPDGVQDGSGNSRAVPISQ